MQANRGRDTAPERAIRTILHGHGLRYRVDHALPFDRRRRADIAFTKVGLYVFVDGCFWHGCPEHFVQPKTRAEFWAAKITGNRERDRDTDARLADLGVHSLRVWEHESASEAASRIEVAYAALTTLTDGANGAR